MFSDGNGEDLPVLGKRFWSFIKHSRTDKRGIPSLKCGNSVLTDSKDKAELLNSHFKSIYSESSPMKLKHAANAAVRNLLADQTNHPIMPSITITVNGIRTLLTKLNPHKAPGPDKLHPLVLKELSSSIAPALCRIFKASLESGVVPSD